MGKVKVVSQNKKTPALKNTQRISKVIILNKFLTF